MEFHEPRRKPRTRRARERYEARRRQRDAMAVPRTENVARADHIASQPPPEWARLAQAAWLWMRDALWHARRSALTWKVGAGALAAVIALFLLSHWLTGRIFPHVSALGVSLGGQTVEEATTALSLAWRTDIRLALVVDGELIDEVAPSQLGLEIDAAAMASAALSAGLSGYPFGYTVAPVVSMDYLRAEQFMVARAQQINSAPYDAGYAWENGQVVGVPGRSGRELNVTATLDLIDLTIREILSSRRIELLTVPIPPNYTDPAPYLDDARALLSQPFQMTSYDPFSDTTTTWATQPQYVAPWLAVGSGRLVVREDAFREFVALLNETIGRNDELRYINHEEAIVAVSQAVRNGEPRVTLRLTYRPEVYTVQRGDTAFGIARRTGRPFFLMQEVNPGRDLGSLFPGDQVNLPPRDVTLPLPPVPHKRIIVNLETQQLYAFEHGEIVFQWRISSGRASAPTAPGIYQILNHDPVALGSSFTLCDANSCGQWQMQWFMGIYEVQRGLVNGFHGAVLLPNGGYLGGGEVNAPTTFGCIMSLDANAKLLYDWADVGTMVEIISRDYPPTSELGRRVAGGAL